MWWSRPNYGGMTLSSTPPQHNKRKLALLETAFRRSYKTGFTCCRGGLRPLQQRGGILSLIELLEVEIARRVRQLSLGPKRGSRAPPFKSWLLVVLLFGPRPRDSKRGLRRSWALCFPTAAGQRLPCQAAPYFFSKRSRTILILNSLAVVELPKAKLELRSHRARDQPPAELRTVVPKLLHAHVAGPVNVSKPDLLTCHRGAQKVPRKPGPQKSPKPRSPRQPTRLRPTLGSMMSRKRCHKSAASMRWNPAMLRPADPANTISHIAKLNPGGARVSSPQS